MKRAWSCSLLAGLLVLGAIFIAPLTNAHSPPQVAEQAGLEMIAEVPTTDPAIIGDNHALAINSVQERGSQITQPTSHAEAAGNLKYVQVSASGASIQNSSVLFNDTAVANTAVVISRFDKCSVVISGQAKEVLGNVEHSQPVLTVPLLCFQNGDFSPVSVFAAERASLEKGVGVSAGNIVASANTSASIF